MTPTLSPPRALARRSARRESRASQRGDHARARRPQVTLDDCRLLARYTDWQQRPREVVAQRGSAGSVLIVDREPARSGDRRLVAHLAADEPAANATLECERYVEAARSGRCRCRLLTADDLQARPFAEDCEQCSAPARGTASELLDQHGRSYSLLPSPTAMSIPELRWRRHPRGQLRGESWPVSVREAIAQLQAYEPVRTLTFAALAAHRADAELSTAVLRAELQRVLVSPIVLNRALRETVLAVLERQDLSLSEIAIRCGRVKRDRRGNESGETSWLARRLGILPEGGRDAPTPWIHSDVLALIARRGLAVSPREVELQ